MNARPLPLTPSARKDVDDLRDWLSLWAHARRLRPDQVTHCELRYDGSGDPARGRRPRLHSARVTCTSPILTPEGTETVTVVEIPLAEITRLKDISRSAITRTAFLADA